MADSAADGSLLSEPSPALVNRVSSFGLLKAAFSNAELEAFSLVQSDATAAIARADALWAQIAELEPTEEQLIVDFGIGAPEAVEACRARWQMERTTVLTLRWNAARVAGIAAERVRTSEMAHDAFAGTPGDSFWGKIYEQDAENTSDAAEIARLLDMALPIRLAAGEYLEAARNRMRAAAFAGVYGQMERQRDCAAQAIAIADANQLRREQIAFRISRYSMLLLGDQSGTVRDELRAELDFTWRPVGSLPSRLETVYSEGKQQLEQTKNAAEVASLLQSFGLGREAANVADATDADAFGQALVSATMALAAQKEAQQLNLLLLASQFKGLLGDPDTPVQDILPAALTLASTPEDVCRVYSAFADAWEIKGNVSNAVAAAENAYEAVRLSGPAETRAQAAARWHTLQCQLAPTPAPAQHDPALDGDDDATRKQQEALSRIAAGDATGGIAILDNALSLAQTSVKKATLKMMRAVALYSMEQLPEAEEDLKWAAEVFAATVGDRPEADGDLLLQRETAYLLLGFIYARQDRAVESWTTAEMARSLLLRRALGLLPASWEVVRNALSVRKAALLELCVLRWGTLVVTAAPNDESPTVAVLPSFVSGDVVRLFERPDWGDDSDAWTQLLMDGMPEVSRALGPLLRDELERITASAQILYFVTDGPLAHAPWAALDLGDGRLLADLTPFALLPFTSLLVLEDKPRKTTGQPSMTALATGKDLTGFDFAQHLVRLEPQLAQYASASFAGALATSAALLHAAANDEIVYLSSHGTLDHVTSDVDRASSLLLADSIVASQDFARLNSAFGLEEPTFLFLNACQSGRFRPLTRTELGGFPRAMLMMGRRALIAPLTHVEPGGAVALAEAFLQSFRAGASAASALQAARLQLRRNGAATAVWAAHQMFGLDTSLY